MTSDDIIKMSKHISGLPCRALILDCRYDALVLEGGTFDSG